MSTGFGEPITPDPSQKQSRSPGTGEVQAEDKEEEEKKKKKKKKKKMTTTAAVAAMATSKTGRKKDSGFIPERGIKRDEKKEKEREREREGGDAYNPLWERRRAAVSSSSRSDNSAAAQLDVPTNPA